MDGWKIYAHDKHSSQASAYFCIGLQYGQCQRAGLSIKRVVFQLYVEECFNEVLKIV